MCEHQKHQNKQTTQQDPTQVESGVVTWLSNNQWFEQFKPIRNHLGKGGPANYMFKPYGPELEYVKATPNNTIWTLVEIDWDMLIVPGLHLGELKCHFICEVPWNNPNLQVFSKMYRFLTPESKTAVDVDEGEKWKLELGAKCNRLLDFAEAREGSAEIAGQQFAADLRAIVARVGAFEDLETE